MKDGGGVVIHTTVEYRYVVVTPARSSTTVHGRHARVLQHNLTPKLQQLLEYWSKVMLEYWYSSTDKTKLRITTIPSACILPAALVCGFCNSRRIQATLTSRWSTQHDCRPWDASQSPWYVVCTENLPLCSVPNCARNNSRQRSNTQYGLVSSLWPHSPVVVVVVVDLVAP